MSKNWGQDCIQSPERSLLDEEHSGLRAMPKMKIGVGIMCVMTLILSVQGRILHLEESDEVPRYQEVQFKSQKIFLGWLETWSKPKNKTKGLFLRKIHAFFYEEVMKN